MTRDVAKTDLKIRPIHHQKQIIEPHIWMGIMAYQIETISEVKEKKIYSWTTIVVQCV